jgi:LSD1 subclass zinc finger protein
VPILCSDCATPLQNPIQPGGSRFKCKACGGITEVASKPKTRSDVMVLTNEDEDSENTHPYWYARVIGIFHAMVCRVGGAMTFEQTDFLWVRWYSFNTHACSGFKAQRLHQIGFLNSHEDTGAFGFIDPSDVIRAIHLMPAFHHGTNHKDNHFNMWDWIFDHLYLLMDNFMLLFHVLLLYST